MCSDILSLIVLALIFILAAFIVLLCVLDRYPIEVLYSEYSLCGYCTWLICQHRNLSGFVSGQRILTLLYVEHLSCEK